MENQKSLMSVKSLPTKWQPRYVLKRIGEEDLSIGFAVRNQILGQLDRGGKYIQIGEYTIMLNAIKSIEPKWGVKNIPPPPNKMLVVESVYDQERNTFSVQEKENPEYIEWLKYFGKEENDKDK